ncbi:energy-converting hydrogenase Eha subunit A [Arcanobacterium wilhelmae]|uniref:Energy-converting hydrogenase Eha subunit A n=1 Tax=Arcanobacterium wilhelmae TaxID=1803177 RepID=A0ABT9NAB7_9ACTO|nr:mechanosensitive ion channel domain-containing protein [Arcanobacterium wilhelmae]MDP9800663.1 energy-converting hydrogenase Eha subunit A [Arcanobacterium wilhelmae]WFN90066.1 mechanosensitive ion channel [Arcanobacterium wilhelmae]
MITQQFAQEVLARFVAQSPSPSPAPSPSSLEEKAHDVVEASFDVVQLVIGVGVGALAGLVIGLVTIGILTAVFARQKHLKPVVHAVARPIDLLLIVVGAWVGFNFAASNVSPDVEPWWFAYSSQMFLILTIIAVTYLVASVAKGIVTSIYARVSELSSSKAARIETQTQILHRVIIVAIWLIGFAAVLLTFPGARAAGASLLASAGVMSVVVGIAAQGTLSNVFAGLQLAFSDSIRVGDIVDFDGNYTTVEEITLTYVVLAIWDGRRIIVPSQRLTSQPFQNWTRRAPEMYGDVTWQVDWAVPVRAMRLEVERLLAGSDLWDGRLGVFQVNDASGGTLTVRAVISAKDSSTLVDLKNYLREQIVLWIQKEARQAIPHRRDYWHENISIEDSGKATTALVEARIAQEQRLKNAESVRPQPAVPHFSSTSELVQQDSESTRVLTATEMEAIAQKAEQAKSESETSGAEEHKAGSSSGKGVSRGKSIAKAAREFASSGKFKRTPIAERMDEPVAGESKETPLTSPVTTTANVKPGHEASLFSGSPENEQRAETYAGPGEEAYEERNRKVDEAKIAAKGNPAAIQSDDAAGDSAGQGADHD